MVKEFVKVKVATQFFQDIIKKIYVKNVKKKDLLKDSSAGDGVRRGLGVFDVVKVNSRIKKI